MRLVGIEGVSFALALSVMVRASMGTESIEIDGRQTETLRELIAPGLRAVFVGLNPSPVSVAQGHYYQGRLGKRFRMSSPVP